RGLMHGSLGIRDRGARWTARGDPLSRSSAGRPTERADAWVLPASSPTLGPMTKHNAMTLVIPLKAKDGIALQDFYDYWLNAHVTLPPRFPGISSVWLHKTSLADSLWPAVDGVSMRPEEEDTFDGVPEATFPTMDDLQAFIKASRVQMEDGINFLSQEIRYASLAPHRARAREQ